MPKLPGINHLEAVRAFQKVGFVVIRQGKHITMRKEQKTIVIPRAHPINAFTMGGIIRDAGLTVEQFKKVL
jgi:predicted RNA binding protein YcfA (HicA-like mRNA interferase family)